MGWHDGQDTQFADTLAGVDDVDAESSPSARRHAPEPRRPSDIDIRREIQERLSAFRQRIIETKRDIHYEQAMQRIRAVTEQRP